MYNFPIFVEDLVVHSEIKSNQINTNTMKIKHLFLSVLAVAAVAVACKKEDPNDGKPSLTLNPTSLEFDVDGGTKTVAVEANREWSIADGDKNAWVKAEKTSDNQITVTVEANTSFDRSAEFTVRMVGTKKTLTVAQKGSGSQSDAYVYHNNFDKADAVKASSGWPYLDKTDVWKNEEGSGVSTVAYASSSASVRQSGKLSDAEGFTDYAGSGRNKIFFGANSNFQIQNITLPGSTDFELTFGGNKYGMNEASNVFSHDEFKVYLSNDGKKYVEIEYAFANGDPDGKWSLASSKFTVPSGTTALYIYFACNKASVYSIDDVSLLTSTTAGTAIDFSKGTEIGGGSTPAPEPGEWSDLPNATGEGTEASPYNVAKVLNILHSSSIPSAAVYVKGKISSIKEVNTTQFGNATYNISDDGTTTNEFMIFRGYYFGGAKFTSESQIKVGDEVVVCGTIVMYNGTTPEMNASNKLISINGEGGGSTGPVDPTPGPTPDPEEPGADGTYSLTISEIADKFTATTVDEMKGFTVTSNGVKVTYWRAGGNADPMAPSDLLRLYQHHSLTISVDGKKVKKVALTLNTKINGLTINSDEDKFIEPVNSVVTWEGTATSEFKCTASKAQVRIQKIVVVTE